MMGRWGLTLVINNFMIGSFDSKKIYINVFEYTYEKKKTLCNKCRWMLWKCAVFNIYILIAYSFSRTVDGDYDL